MFPRDASWKAEARHETLKMICAVEQRAVAANIAAWLIMAAGALALPNSEVFVIPLALRLVVMLLNRWGWRNLRRSLKHGPDARLAIVPLYFCLFLAGSSLALVFLPLLFDPVLHPARMAVGGTVLVSVGLIISLLGSLRSVALSFACGFLCTFAIGIAHAPGTMGVVAVVPMSALVLTMMAFAFASSRQQIVTARTLVDNRRLEEQLAESLAHAEFLSTRDPLTGLLNRRAFFEDGEGDCEHMSVGHLLTIDLDHFKAINDTFGHAAGDRVLVETAQHIKELVRSLPGEGHRACRLGGEEFVVYVQQLDDVVIRTISEALRRRIETLSQSFDQGEPMLVSASIGIASIAEGENIDEALRRSDLALYRAKDRGRNCVVKAA